MRGGEQRERAGKTIDALREALYKAGAAGELRDPVMAGPGLVALGLLAVGEAVLCLVDAWEGKS